VTLEQLPVPEGACRKGGEGLFTRLCSDRTRGNGSKLKEGRFRLNIRKKFLPMRVMRHWNRLPREAVAGLKARLNGAPPVAPWLRQLPMAAAVAGHCSPPRTLVFPMLVSVGSTATQNDSSPSVTGERIQQAKSSWYFVLTVNRITGSGEK